MKLHVTDNAIELLQQLRSTISRIRARDKRLATQIVAAKAQIAGALRELDTILAVLWKLTRG